MKEKFYQNLLIFLTIFLIFQVNLKADIPYFVDFKYILNQSNAGKQAQDYLKKN